MADSDSEMSRAFVDTSLLGVAISLPIIASAAVGLRFYARTSKVKGMLKTDDWAVFITLIVCWGHSINTIVAGAIGGVNTITILPREYANVALRVYIKLLGSLKKNTDSDLDPLDINILPDYRVV